MTLFIFLNPESKQKNREKGMEDKSLWLLLNVCASFFGAMVGGFVGAIVLGTVYYVWLKKSEEERFWTFGKQILGEGLQMATSFMKSVVSEIPDESSILDTKTRQTPPGSQKKMIKQSSRITEQYSEEEDIDFPE